MIGSYIFFFHTQKQNNIENDRCSFNNLNLQNGMKNITVLVCISWLSDNSRLLGMYNIVLTNVKLITVRS